MSLTSNRKLIAAWLMTLSFVVLILVVWGAMVRLTGSGLSIPDWPLINGSLLPPTSDSGWAEVQEDYRREAAAARNPEFPVDIPLDRFKTSFWIEYLHRALAAAAGLFFFLIMLKSYRAKDVWGDIDGHLMLLAVLLMMQAGLGGIVVKTALPAVLVTIHLAVAFLFYGLMIWTVLKLSRPPKKPGLSRSGGFAAMTLAVSVVCIIYIQILFGGLVAGSGAGRVMNTFPLINNRLVPLWGDVWSPVWGGFASNLARNPVLQQFVHRWLGAAALLVVIILWINTASSALSIWGKRALVAAILLMAMQIGIGIINLLLETPVVVSLAHSALALLLFGALIVLVHEMRFGVDESVV